MLIPNNSFGSDQIDHSDKPIFHADGNLGDEGKGPQAFNHHLHRPKEIRSDSVHLIDKGQFRNPIFIGLMPHGLGLRLHSFDRTEDRNRPIQHTQRTLYFNREVHMTGGIDNMNDASFPFDRCHSRGDRNSPFLFLLHPVHGGCPIIYLSHAVGLLGIEKDSLGDSRLSSIDVGHKPNIPCSGEPFLSSHLFLSMSEQKYILAILKGFLRKVNLLYSYCTHPLARV